MNKTEVKESGPSCDGERCRCDGCAALSAYMEHRNVFEELQELKAEVERLKKAAEQNAVTNGERYGRALDEIIRLKRELAKAINRDAQESGEFE